MRLNELNVHIFCNIGVIEYFNISVLSDLQCTKLHYQKLRQYDEKNIFLRFYFTHNSVENQKQKFYWVILSRKFPTEFPENKQPSPCKVITPISHT